MKLLTRALIILAAGALVAGALLAFARTGLATQLREEGSRGGHLEGRGGPPPAFDQSGESQQGALDGDGAGRLEGRGSDHHGPSLAGLAEVLKNLVKIGVVVALVALGARLLGQRRGERPAPASTGETTRL